MPGLAPVTVAAQTCHLGLEETPEAYVAHLVAIFREIKRVMRDDAVLFLNLGDSYATNPGNGRGGETVAGGLPHRSGQNKTSAGLKQKDLCGIPWRVAFALQADGWWLRSDIVWSKGLSFCDEYSGSAMPESVNGWRFSRHRVIISYDEYEEMLKMWQGTADKRIPQKSQQVPDLRKGICSPISKNGYLQKSTAEIQAKREREGNHAGTGSTSRDQSGSTSLFQERGRESITETLCDQQEGTQECSKASIEVQEDTEGQGKCPKGRQKASQKTTQEKASKGHSPQDVGNESRISRKRKGPQQGLETKPGRPRVGSPESTKAQCIEAVDTRESQIDERGMAGDKESGERNLPLLQQESKESDNRSRNSSVKGRSSQQGKHSSSLPELQQQQRQFNLSPKFKENGVEINCPGCPKCADNPAECPECAGTGCAVVNTDILPEHGNIEQWSCPLCHGSGTYGGYVLRRGSWRPTKAHEMVFMLAKSERYFCDREAVKENVAESSLARISQPTFAQQMGGPKDYGDGGSGVNPNRSMRQVLENFAENPSGRNLRSVWVINPGSYPGAHYAVFPPALVEPCIKAATSEAGVCGECGAPWVRVVNNTGHINKREPAHCPNNSPTKVDSTGWAPTTESTDEWLPSCTCDAPAVPALVLDPFAGSGTTALVARALGRNCVGLDLSAEYLRDQARPRLELDALAAWDGGDGRDGTGEELSTLPLFAEMEL